MSQVKTVNDSHVLRIMWSICLHVLCRIFMLWLPYSPTPQILTWAFGSFHIKCFAIAFTKTF